MARRRPAAIALDEFQAIVDLGDHLPGLFKGLADKHPGVALVVAGSKKHLMDQLVAAPTAALHESDTFADRFELLAPGQRRVPRRPSGRPVVPSILQDER